MTNVIVNAVVGRSFTVLPSVARTAAPNTIEYRQLTQASGLILVVDVTAIDASPSITAKILGVDPIVDKTWEILASAAIGTVSTTVLKVHPGITAATNAAAADALPPNIRIEVTHADADSITYSVTAHLLY